MLTSGADASQKTHVLLTVEQREHVEGIIRTGMEPARTQTHARILLKADRSAHGPAWQDAAIVAALDVRLPTVERVRRAVATQGLDVALHRRTPVRSRRRKLDGEQEAHLVALTSARACALDLGRARRALRCPPSCRLECAGNRAPDAYKNDLTPWLKQEWKIPPQQNAAFVAPMEDVRDVYARPLHPKRPLVCFDESNKQHLKEVIEPLPLQPDQPQRCASTYERGGASNLFMCFAPLLNWRHVTVTDRRTAIDWAPCLKDLVDVHVPDAERGVVVQDNLSTHTPAALSAAFPPQEAKCIWDRREVHDTPTPGSWLNMAAIECSVLSRPCRNRRIGDHPTLIEQIAAWEERRNAAKATVQ